MLLYLLACSVSPIVSLLGHLGRILNFIGLPQFFLRDCVQFYWTKPSFWTFEKLFNTATNAGHKPVFLRPHSSRWKTEKSSCASALQLSGGLCGCGEAVVVQLPDMLLQVEVATEALAAGGTGEGLLVVVCVHVEGEVVHLVERLAADGTLELLLAAVRQLVVLVVSCTEKQEMYFEHSLFTFRET